MNNISTELCKLRLEVRMNKVGTKDWFNSAEKVNFYTGLPNSYVLMTVFEFVSSGTRTTRKHGQITRIYGKYYWGLNYII